MVVYTMLVLWQIVVPFITVYCQTGTDGQYSFKIEASRRWGKIIK